MTRRLRARLGAETRGLARDTFLLGLGDAATVAANVAQIALISHVLGLATYGVFALVVSVVAVVARFFDVQAGDTALVFGTPEFPQRPRSTLGVFQFSYIVDFVAGVIGFAVVLIVSPFVAPSLIGSDGVVLIALYALTLLTSTTDTTSLSLLRMLQRFDLILRLIVAREVMRVAFVAGALFFWGGLRGVLIALVLMSLLFGVGSTLVAASVFRAESGGLRLLRPSLYYAHSVRRAMLRMMFHTNLVTYAKLVAAQGPTLILGVLRTPLEVGAFKIATALAAGVGRVAAPAGPAVLPRLLRLLRLNNTAELRRMLRNASVFVGTATAAVGLVVIILREQLTVLIGGDEAVIASTAVIFTVLAQLVGAIVFWNTSLLYAEKQAKVAARIYVAGTIFLCPTVALLTYRWGSAGAAGALFVTATLANSALTIAALRGVNVAGAVGSDDCAQTKE